METIKNYLESMFANMPNTESVRRAKEELLQMMEDKYNELLSEGESENSAIGTVISEFGNLDELADDLGVSQELSEINMELAESPVRFIGYDEARDYITDQANHGLKVAIGVMLCIMSVIGPILTEFLHFNEAIGVLFMFVMIAVAVALFIYSGVNNAKWEYIKKESCRIDIKTAKLIDEENASYTKTYALWLTIGIVLCAICWLPTVIMSEISKYIEDLGVVFLFALVGIGVFLIVYSANIRGSYETLLKLNNPAKISGNYVKGQEQTEWVSEGAAIFMELYWPAITCAYLIWSFLTFKWYISWIIWPVAGMIRVFLKIILRKRY